MSHPEGAGPSRFGSRIGSGRRRLGVVVSAVVLVGTGGWFAGTQVQSPADAAASHRAPKAGPVTVSVVRQSLTASVVATGSVEFASPRPLSLAGPVGSGASAGADGEGAEQRVTKAPVAGTKIKEGDVLMTVNGRPVFALGGSVPMYRALGPGTSGDDVTQLQKALKRLGFDPGGTGGTYGQGTATAVADWYKSKGYDAQEPSPTDQQQLGSLEQAVSAAQETLLITNSGAGTASSSETGSSSTPAPQSSTDKQVHEIQVKSAQKALDLANGALSSFKATYGTKVPAGEVVFLPKLPARLDKVSVKTGDTPSAQIGTVTSSDVVVQAAVPGTDAQLLRHGMTARLTTADGKSAQGTVDVVADDSDSSSGTESAATAPSTTDDTNSASDSAADSTAAVQVRITVPEPGPLAGEAEAAVKVTIKVGASDGKVLTVPMAAIHTSSDGRARVKVERGDAVTDVHVTVGLSAAGIVEVKPDGGTLEAGERVVVGE
ncbi:peptidoglycan-binding protein [Streptomyces prunicolor]|uniref:Peptidoglycan-binding protein n=1 Tax=Streptomyces prunicolor TaxID=67348 RepID=A0ABU4FBF1_9ACTN|nr:peptidoglycan-binding protein [Streptomyces prunicolor]MDV7217891.1 peptidoglycan-binding protein [Streptomyces prunicolor]